MVGKNVAKNTTRERSACLEAGLQERGAVRTLERFIGNSLSLYFVSNTEGSVVALQQRYICMRG